MIPTRRKFLIGRVQYRLLALSLTYVAVTVAAFFLIFFVPLIVKLQSDAVSEAERSRAADLFLQLHSYGWFVIGGLVTLFLLHMVLMSHRIAGPIYRFAQIFRSIGDGDLTVAVRLREKDYLQEEADVLREAVERLRVSITGLKNDVLQIARVGSDVCFAIQEGESDYALRNVQDLERRIVALQKQLDRFTTHRGAADPADEPAVVTEPSTTETRGFSLVELTIVMSIIAILAVLGVPNYNRALEAARVARAIGDIRAIEKDVASWETANGAPPPTLAAIDRDTLLDPWRRPYVYLNFEASGAGIGQMRKDRFLVPLNSTYDLYSKGRNGVTKMPLNAGASRDDIVRANDGAFVGLAGNF